MVFGDKNSDMCLLHKIKSFDLKKKKSDMFLRTKKKKEIWFVIDFMITKKSNLFFIFFKKMKKIF